MVGTTRGRVNYFMRKFKQRGFIEERSGVLYVDAAHLRDVHDDDRRIAIAASVAMPQAPQSGERRWPLAG